jgi:hypothetical protein
MKTVQTALDRLEAETVRAFDPSTLKQLKCHTERLQAGLQRRTAEVRGLLVALEDLEEQCRAINIRIEHQLAGSTVEPLRIAANDPNEFGSSLPEPLRLALRPFITPRALPIEPEAA